MDSLKEPTDTSQHQVCIYSKPGCHLCEEVKEVLCRCAERNSLIINEVDISKDPTLLREYGHRIPVVTIDGKEISRHLLQEHKLLKVLMTKT